jgi:hypothetical protein
MAKQKKPRVYIYVEGGVVQGVYTDSPVDVMILDGDVEGSDDYKEYKCYRSPDTLEAHEVVTEAEQNKKLVDHYFKQRKSA